MSERKVTLIGWLTLLSILAPTMGCADIEPFWSSVAFSILVPIWMVCYGVFYSKQLKKRNKKEEI